MMALVSVEHEKFVSEPDALPLDHLSKLFLFFFFYRSICILDNGARSFSSDTYQGGSSEWRAQKRPSIYRRSRALIGRESMGVTAKLYTLGSQLSENMQNL